MTAAQLAARLPSVEVVRRWSQSLAVLDAIMSAEWEYRYFSFDADFDLGQDLASMRNCSRDEYSITFTCDGAFLRGFDHESPLSPFGRSTGQLGIVARTGDHMARRNHEPPACRCASCCPLSSARRAQ